MEKSKAIAKLERLVRMMEKVKNHPDLNDQDRYFWLFQENGKHSQLHSIIRNGGLPPCNPKYIDHTLSRGGVFEFWCENVKGYVSDLTCKKTAEEILAQIEAETD